MKLIASGISVANSNDRERTQLISNGSEISCPLLNQEPYLELKRSAFEKRKELGLYKFDFSTQTSLKSSKFCLVVFILALFTILAGIPVLLRYEASKPDRPGKPHKDFWDKYSNYGWFFYLMLINGLLLLIGGRCIVSSIAYPYSSRLFRRNLARTTNEKFGLEFKRCVTRLADVVEHISNPMGRDPELSDILIVDQDDAQNAEDDENYVP